MGSDITRARENDIRRLQGGLLGEALRNHGLQLLRKRGDVSDECGKVAGRPLFLCVEDNAIAVRRRHCLFLTKTSNIAGRHTQRQGKEAEKKIYVSFLFVNDPIKVINK